MIGDGVRVDRAGRADGVRGDGVRGQRVRVRSVVTE